MGRNCLFSSSRIDYFHQFSFQPDIFGRVNFGASCLFSFFPFFLKLQFSLSNHFHFIVQRCQFSNRPRVMCFFVSSQYPQKRMQRCSVRPWLVCSQFRNQLPKRVNNFAQRCCHRDKNQSGVSHFLPKEYFLLLEETFSSLCKLLSNTPTGRSARNSLKEERKNTVPLEQVPLPLFSEANAATTDLP